MACVLMPSVQHSKDSVSFQKYNSGASLVAHWLRLCAPKAWGLGLIPGQGTRSHMAQLKRSCTLQERSQMLQLSQINTFFFKNATLTKPLFFIPLLWDKPMRCPPMPTLQLHLLHFPTVSRTHCLISPKAPCPFLSHHLAPAFIVASHTPSLTHTYHQSTTPQVYTM